MELQDGNYQRPHLGTDIDNFKTLKETPLYNIVFSLPDI